MFINKIIKLSWRNIVRNKQFAVINLIGLTLGLTAAISTALFIHHESTFDQFHKHKNRIYRINQSSIWDDWSQPFASTGPGVSLALKEDILEFEEITRLFDPGVQTLRKSSMAPLFKEDRFYGVDENFFKVFSFQLVQGDAETVLADPGSMVITQSLARRLFSEGRILGKVIEAKQPDGQWKKFTITGVVQDPPRRSHLQFNFLISLNSYEAQMQKHGWKWIWTVFSTYGLVAHGVDLSALNKKIQVLPPKWASSTTERVFNRSYESFTDGRPWKLFLQPLSDIYLSSPDFHRFGPNGRSQFLWIFAFTGVLILALSIINFINLNTAQALARLKSVRIQKILGADRRTIVLQFLIESVSYCFLSLLFAFLGVGFLTSTLNVMTDTELSIIPYLGQVWFWGLTLGFVFVVGVIAGTYPALYLSSFSSNNEEKGGLSQNAGEKRIRNGLVVFQFLISIGLIICAVFVRKQVDFSFQKDLGLDTEHILQIHNVEQLGDKDEIFRTKLLSHPAFSEVGKSFAVPPHIWDGEPYQTVSQDNTTEISTLRASCEYVSLLNLDFLAGRGFSKERFTDRYGVILNRKAAEVLGLGDSLSGAIGKEVVEAFDNREKYKVLGIVENFNFHDLKVEIEPLIILHTDNDLLWNYNRGRSFLSIKLKGEILNKHELQTALEFIEKELAGIDPSVLFEYSFMNEEFDKAFKFEVGLSKVIMVFTGIALIIAALGLYGQAIYTAERRMKEFGIRKVLGAKISTLFLLFISDLVRLILLATAFAVPVSYLLMTEWLSQFVYRTTLNPGVFIWSFLGAMSVALLTIGGQVLTLTHQNPIEVLKDE